MASIEFVLVRRISFYKFVFKGLVRRRKVKSCGNVLFMGFCRFCSRKGMLFRGISSPLNLICDRIVFMVSLWCSGHGLFMDSNISHLQQDRTPFLYNFKEFPFFTYFVLSLLRISYPLIFCNPITLFLQ